MPVIKFSKIHILRKTLEYATQNGFDDISARKLADYIGCSVIPIYSSFGTIGGLLDEAREEIVSMILSSMDINHIKNNQLISAAIAIICFARDNEYLYREVLIDNANQEYIDKITMKIYAYMVDTRNTLVNEFSIDEIKIYMSKIWISIQGISAMVCSGQLKNASNEFLANALQETGINILRGMLFNKGTLGNLDHYKPEIFETKWEILDWS